MAAQMIKNDEKMLRTCILYESVEGVSAFDAFRNFVKKIGDDVIDYQEFEFWYQRFSRGECDLDYDRSLIPKSRRLLDLPKEIMEEVIRNVPPIDRLIFRKTCKPIKNIITGMNPGFTRIHVTINSDVSTLSLEDRPSMRHDEPLNHKIAYTTANSILEYPWEDCRVEKVGHPRYVIMKGWPGTLALGDLFVILANPGLVLEELSIDCSIMDASHIQNHFDTLTRKIKASRVKITTNMFHEERHILPYLDSTVIREIELNMVDGMTRAGFSLKSRKDRMRRLVGMDAWKGAESKVLRLYYNTVFPVEELMDCKKLTVYMHFETRSMNSVIKWMKALFSSPVLQLAHIRTQFQLIPEQLFGHDVINQNGRRHFPIPETNEVFEILILGWYESGVRYSDLCIERRMNWLI